LSPTIIAEETPNLQSMVTFHLLLNIRDHFFPIWTKECHVLERILSFHAVDPEFRMGGQDSTCPGVSQSDSQPQTQQPGWSVDGACLADRLTQKSQIRPALL
jgi:hypothetical protein